MEKLEELLVVLPRPGSLIPERPDVLFQEFAGRVDEEGPEAIEVGRARGPLDLRAPVQPPAEAHRAGFRPVVAQVLYLNAQRVERREVGLPVSGIALFQLRDLPGRRADAADQALVAEERNEKQQDEKNRGDGGSAGESETQNAPAFFHLRGAPREVLVGENDLREEVAEKIALLFRFLLGEASGLFAESECPSHGGDDAVDGRALLRAAGEVETSEG